MKHIKITKIEQLKEQTKNMTEKELDIMINMASMIKFINSQKKGA